jgi:ATP-binding cassette, subfamily B, bacterial MsbA
MKIFFRIIFRYVRPYWKTLFASIVCIFLFTIFNSASLVSIMPFLKTLFQPPTTEQVVHESSEIISPELLDSVVPTTFEKWRVLAKDKIYSSVLTGDRIKALKRICFLIIGLMFLKNIFAYLQAYLMAKVEQGVIRDIRDDLYKHINSLSLSYFHQTRTGQIISRITNDVNLVNGGISASFVTLIKNPLVILVSVSIAIILSWKLTLIALVVAPFSMGIIGWIGLKLRKQSAVSQAKMADVTSVLQETLSGVRVVKAFAMESFEIKKFMVETQHFFTTLLKITRIRNLASPLTEFLGTSVAVGILWFGGQEVLHGRMLAPEEFILFLLVIFTIMQPVKELSSVNNRIQEALAAAERIFQVLDLEPSIQNVQNPKVINSFKNNISFKNVFFRYNKKDIVLQDISITVKKGEILAIVGPSGAGKSTLVDLVPRFYDPVTGEIEIDGTDIKNIELNSLRRLMGIVTQDTILFNDSVRNNIAYGSETIPLENIKKAAKVANAHDFIDDLPNGYDTNIGERGVTLSGGQRQRLAIARAVLKNPPILILDEATSSLDTESELLVQQAIERLMENRTSFVIAHRLSTILNASRIIVIENGSIVEHGTNKELLKKGGLYKKLYDMQFRM